MTFEQEVIERLKALTIQQHEHTIQLALNTKSLDEHHKRTRMLEERFEPIEKMVIFQGMLARFFVGLTAMLAALAATYNYLVKH